MSDSVDAQNNLETKRAQFTEKPPKKSPVTLVVVALVVAALAVAGYFVISGSDSASTNGIIKDDMVRVSLASLEGGKAQFFDHKLANNTTVRFFAIKSTDGKYRAAMDACDTCFHAKKGYRQAGEVMICNNCGMSFHGNLINEVKGGCNPVGVACSVEGEQLVIHKSELESRGSYFQ